MKFSGTPKMIHVAIGNLTITGDEVFTQVAVNGKKVACQSIRLEKDHDSPWSVEMTFLPTLVEEDP